MEALDLEDRLRYQLSVEYWNTQDPEIHALGGLLDRALAIVDRLAAGDYSAN